MGGREAVTPKPLGLAFSHLLATLRGEKKPPSSCPFVPGSKRHPTRGALAALCRTQALTPTPGAARPPAQAGPDLPIKAPLFLFPPLLAEPRRGEQSSRSLPGRIAGHLGNSSRATVGGGRAANSKVVMEKPTTGGQKNPAAPRSPGPGDLCRQGLGQGAAASLLSRE